MVRKFRASRRATAPSRRVSGSRTAAKRKRIVDGAMLLFAEKGYHGAHLAELAASLGISKASVLQHFGSKDALFMAAYRQAVSHFPAYLDAPGEVLQEGFFATLHYWLARTDHLVREDWAPYRVALVGNYQVDLRLKREINRFLGKSVV